MSLLLDEETGVTRAAWVPGWYELDPSLEVGRAAEFAFWRVVPEHLRGPEPLVLYNDLWRPEDAVMAQGTIAAIQHPELGGVRAVDTRGLDYILTLEEGTQLLVNAEEEPGRLWEQVAGEWVASVRKVSDWRFVIDFSRLSELRDAE
jgi:hypothetical protein